MLFTIFTISEIIDIKTSNASGSNPLPTIISLINNNVRVKNEMKPKYNVGDEVWSWDIDRLIPRRVTIKSISEVDRYFTPLIGDYIEEKSIFYETNLFYRAEAELFASEEKALTICIRINNRKEKQRKLKEEFKALIENGNYVSDGIYDLEGIDFIAIDGNIKLGIEWIKNHKKFWIANAYETDFPILLSDEPRCVNSKKWNKENWIGSGFNYGSTNIIRNCPKDILILAEND